MNLYLRLLLVWLKNASKSKRHLTHDAVSRFRVLPNDIDFFGHMNNGRYLQIMDVARAEWMLQTQVAGTISRNRWSPLLGGGVIRFRFSLRLMQVYRVHTRLLGWDQRWFYLEHTFRDDRDRCIAVGVTRAGVRDGSDWVHANDVVNSMHPGIQSPEIPGHVSEWIELEEAMFRHAAGLPHARRRTVASRSPG